jgi:hypothetical protein
MQKQNFLYISAEKYGRARTQRRESREDAKKILKLNSLRLRDSLVLCVELFYQEMYS